MNIIDNYLSDSEWERALQLLHSDRWVYPPELDSNHNMTMVWRIKDTQITTELGIILFSKLDAPDWCVKRVGVNGSMPMIESHWHQDGTPDDLSLVWFANKEWKQEWGGELLIGEDKVDFVPNRAVLFNSHLMHRPNSPTSTAQHKLRMSVGLHMERT
jgi:hypothetical protein